MGMVCQRCKKARATVHVTNVVGAGEKQERHLCDNCAQEEGYAPKPAGGTSLPEMLSGFLGQKPDIRKIADLRCPQCGLTFVEFRNAGLLGCAACYEALQQALVPLIERSHEGASHHIGKMPRRTGGSRAAENDRLRLERELRRAVDDENYEEAARLRDALREFGA